VRITVLNWVASRIWELCDGKHKVSEIYETLLSEFEVDPKVLEKDLARVFQELKQRDIIVLRSE